MYPLAGITDHLTPTSIRRGFAQDLSRVANIPRSNTELVRRALGHSQKKVTELYIGEDDISYNKLIADNSQGPTHKDALMGTHTASLLDLRTTPQEVADYCNANGLDANNSSHKQKARQALRRGRLARYRTIASESRHQIASHDETSTTQSSTVRSSTLQSQSTNSLVFTAETLDRSSIDQFSMDIPPFDEHPVAQFQIHDDEISMLDSLIQADLQPEQGQRPSVTFEEMLSQDVHIDLESSPMTAFEQLLITDAIYQSPHSVRTEWRAFTALEFVEFFSKINDTNRQRPMTTCPIEGGNSRDQPSSFMYRCDTEFENGDVCDYTIGSSQSFKKHRASCRPLNRPKPKRFQCKDCPETFLNRKAVTLHKKHVHEWVTQPCTEPGCPTDVLYNNWLSFHQHKRTHSQIVCPHQACSDKNQAFATRETLRAHIKKMHKDVPADQIASMIPEATVRNKIEQYFCTRCEYKAGKRGSVLSHLERIHKVTYADARVEVGLPVGKRQPGSAYYIEKAQ
jgi:hypothetical protein